MREVNLSGLDLNLLPALEALLRHRNVTLAANEVGLSQPAMSRALARLRAVLDDPLLVRARGGFVLSPRAQALAPQLIGALGAVEDLFQVNAFDPATTRRTISIAASDIHTVLIAPGVMARMAREAPGIRVRMEAYGADIAQRMEAGSPDFAFAVDNLPMPPGAMSEPIAKDRLALVMRRGHPAADKPWTIQDYADFDHVGVALLGDGQSDLDAILANARVRRRISLTTPHFTAALAVVASTDMVTTLSRRFATHFADAFDLVLREPPIPNHAFRMTLAWLHVRSSDPVLGWVRSVIRDVAQGVYGV